MKICVTPLFILALCISIPAMAKSDDMGYLPFSEVAGEPSAIVAGCVNAVTGSYNDAEIDVYLPGPEPLSLQRFYNSSRQQGSFLFSEWTYNHTHRARIDHVGMKYAFYVPESNGGAIEYVGGTVRHQPQTYSKVGNVPIPERYYVPYASITPIQNKDQFKGMTNTGGPEMGGLSHLRNQSVYFEHDRKIIWSYQSDGCRRRFDTLGNWDKDNALPVELTLVEEICRNKNVLMYEYKEVKGIAEKQLPEFITARNHTGHQVFSRLTFDYSQLAVNSNIHHIALSTNDGREIKYSLETHSFENGGNKFYRWYLNEAIRPNAPKVNYEYVHHRHWPVHRLMKKIVADRVIHQLQYYCKGDNKYLGGHINIDGHGDRRVGRVFQLYCPVGIDATPILTHRFLYNSDHTNVYNTYGHRTIYHYDKNDERLTKISRYLGNNDNTYQFYHFTEFFWGKTKTFHEGNLICKAFGGSDSRHRSCTYYEYDDKHNVVAEHLLGNLSGTSSIDPWLNSDGIPKDNGCERYVIRRTYSKDIFNRLATETLPNGRVTELRYRNDSHQVSAKVIMDRTQAVCREFHEFDDNGVIIKTIQDNGSASCHFPYDLTGATYRILTYITPRDSTPCLGLPHIVEKRYLDMTTGKEVTLEKIVYNYTREGWITQEDHYDANLEFQYTIYRDYDYMGNIILEQDPIGQITQRQYDHFHNKIWEQGPDPSFHYEYAYDYANRLIAEARHCTDGQVFKQTYEYDYLGNKIASTDILGHKTEYRYDELGRLIETIFPPSPDANGKLVRLTTQQQYDVAGNVIAITDVNGNTTYKTYNVRNQPTCIQHPDGTTETYGYHLDGNLKFHHNASKVSTGYLKYDVLGHALEKEICDAPSGSLLALSKCTYHGNLLTSETDSLGRVTTYHYDGAGRLIRINKPDTWTAYEYDSLGRKSKTIQWHGPEEDDVRISIAEYDLLNRVVEERVEDNQGKVFTRTLYEYDSLGRRIGVACFGEEGSNTTRTYYDSHGNICKVIDAEGNETHTHYDYWAQNEYGQRILQTTVIDALANQTVTTKDVLGRIATVVRKDHVGIETARHANLYNGQGKLIKRIDTVKAAGTADRESVTEWQYNAVGKVVTLIEASETSLERKTYYAYNRLGQKEHEILPDGTILYFEYDIKGRLYCYYDSANTFAYRYSYDNVDNLLCVHDDIAHTKTLRSYDSSNRLQEEVLANGLKVGYQYDGMNRITELILYDNSSVRYRYDSGHLRSVARIDTHGHETYSHTYLSYDLSGHCTAAQMIGSAGEITYAWDALSRLRHLHSPHFEEFIPENGYDAVGNLLQKTRRDVVGKSDCHYSYDALYQLTDEDGLVAHRYSYDSLHNRRSKDDADYHVDALNQLISCGENHYSYDLRSNRISLTHHNDETNYIYDSLGRLKEVLTAKERYVYTYDSFNRRLSKARFVKATKSDNWQRIDNERYLYQEQMDIGTVDDAGTLIEFRAIGQGLGAEIGAAVSLELRGNIYAPIHDHNGHVVAIVDADNGQVAEAYRYSAFGEETCFALKHSRSWTWSTFSWTIDSSWDVTNNLPSTPWRFSSKRYDPETGLINFGRRYYDPAVGRWLTPDPAGYADGPNLYAYVHNSPLTHFDLYGLYTTTNTGMRPDYCAWSGRPMPMQPQPQSYLGNLRRNIGEALSDLWFHLCPIAPIQRIGMAASRALGGLGFSLPGHYNEPSSSGCYTSFPENGSVPSGPDRIMVITGQCVNQKDCESACNKISGYTIGHSASYMHNASHGLLSDTLESLALIIGIPTNSLKECVAKLKMELDYMKKDGHTGRLKIIAHSQGGLMLSRALAYLDDSERQSLDIITIGSAKLISEGEAGSVRNYIARRDPVPLADPINYIRASFGLMQNVEFIGSLIGKPFDHSMFGETYPNILQREGARHYRAQRR